MNADEYVLCSLGQQPSTTDPITNVVRLQPLQLVQDFRHMKEGAIPAECLPALLHEGMHHWCFLTPLGHALALLHLHARLKLETSGAKRRARAIDALVRFEALDAVLRPIAEGLAVMAEFDGVLDETRLQYESRVAHWILGLTCRDVPRPLKPRTFSALLTKVLTSEDGIARRIRLLKQPFDCRFGGYLPGYMCLRNLWLRAAKDVDGLAEVGSFMSAVRFSVYHDPILIRLAVEESRPAAKVAIAALSRLTQLLTSEALEHASFRRLLSWEEGEAFTFAHLQRAGSPALEEMEDIPFSYVDEDLRRAMQSLSSALREVTATSLPAAVRRTNEAIMRRREWFWLGSESLRVWWDGFLLWTNIAGQKEILATSEPYIMRSIGQIESGVSLEIGEHEARVDYLFALAETCTVSCISVKGKLLSVKRHGGEKHPENADDDLRSLLLGRDEIDRSEHKIRSLMQSHGFAAQRAELSHLRNTAQKRATHSLAGLCFDTASAGNADGLRRALGAGGWFQAFGQNERQLKALAIASVCRSLGLNGAAAEKIFHAYDLSETALDPVLPLLTTFGGHCFLQRAYDT